MKILSSFILVLITITILITLTACGNSEHIHDWSEWTAVEGEEATCTEKGIEERFCKIDPTHTDIRETNPTGHIFGTELFSNALHHWQTCTVCNKRGEIIKHTSDSPATLENAEICNVCGYEMNPKIDMLDGKKILFVGNSFTYYGRCVKAPQGNMNVNQSARAGDDGYFYQLCKSNGHDVSVTNWTYGGHSLKHLFDVCTADRGCDGYDHKADLVDRNFDYVVLQEGSVKSFATTLEQLNNIMPLFREANPNVKFIFLVHHQYYSMFTKDEMNQNLKQVEELGLMIVDWGRIVTDIYRGNVDVPGATQTYNKYSFIISKSETDGFHENLLSGYITALTTYCAITGDAATGQSYSFCTNKQINDYLESYYKIESTNMKEIFNSPSDMNGIQQLVDRYLKEQAYKN